MTDWPAQRCIEGTERGGCSEMETAGSANSRKIGGKLAHLTGLYASSFTRNRESVSVSISDDAVLFPLEPRSEPNLRQKTRPIFLNFQTWLTYANATLPWKNVHCTRQQ